MEFRTAVTSRVWMLDGDDMPARKCKTWQDVADAVDMELETRVDTRCLGNPLARSLQSMREPAIELSDLRCASTVAVDIIPLCARHARRLFATRQRAPSGRMRNGALLVTAAALIIWSLTTCEQQRIPLVSQRSRGAK